MILDQINVDLIAAMKDREPSRKEENSQKVTSLRTLLAEVKTFKMNNKKEPEDLDISAILSRGIKQFRETLEKASGKNDAGIVREDIIVLEKIKIALYEKYLPAQMSEEEITVLVDAAILTANAKGPKDMGAVMGVIRPQTQGKADGRLVSEIVKRKLGG